MDSVSKHSGQRVQVRLMYGRDLEAVNHRIQGLSDPYCVISNQRTSARFESDALSNTTNPNWHQSFFLEGVQPDDILDISCWDKNIGREPTPLGQCKIPVGYALDVTNAVIEGDIAGASLSDIADSTNLVASYNSNINAKDGWKFSAMCSQCSNSSGSTVQEEKVFQDSRSNSGIAQLSASTSSHELVGLKCYSSSFHQPHVNNFQKQDRGHFVFSPLRRAKDSCSTVTAGVRCDRVHAGMHPDAGKKSQVATAEVLAISRAPESQENIKLLLREKSLVHHHLPVDIGNESAVSNLTAKETLKFIDQSSSCYSESDEGDQKRKGNDVFDGAELRMPNPYQPENSSSSTCQCNLCCQQRKNLGASRSSQRSGRTLDMFKYARALSSGSISPETHGRFCSLTELMGRPYNLSMSGHIYVAIMDSRVPDLSTALPRNKYKKFVCMKYADKVSSRIPRPFKKLGVSVANTAEIPQYFKSTIKALHHIGKAYPTWKIDMSYVVDVFGSRRQHWNEDNPQAQKIFHSRAACEALKAQHAVLYGGTGGCARLTEIQSLLMAETGVVSGGEEFLKLLNYGYRSGKSRMFTYVLKEERLYMAETGPDVFLDMNSKHAMHANAATEVVYAGELHFRPIQISDQQTKVCIVLDNKSGTYTPRKEDLPLLKEVFIRNFANLLVEVCDLDDPRLQDYTREVRDNYGSASSNTSDGSTSS